MTQDVATIEAAARSQSAGALRTKAGTLGPAGWLSFAVVLLALLIAVFGPMLAPHDPQLIDLSKAYGGTASGHPLGYDIQGRDVLSRLLVGARTSMLGSLAVVAASIAVGSALAVLSAWRRGWADTFITSGMDIAFAFPGVLLAVLAATVFGVGLPAAVTALSIAYVPYVARVLRSAALRERSLPYVEALQVQGISGAAICMKHLLPNLMPFIVAQMTIMFGYAMVDLAAVSYLGLGVQIPNPDWGLMIAENQTGIGGGYFMPAFAAGACIVVVVVAFNVLGDRLFGRAQGEGR